MFKLFNEAIEAIEATRLPDGILFTLFTLLAYLNYVVRTPLHARLPLPHSRTRFVGRAPIGKHSYSATGLV